MPNKILALHQNSKIKMSDRNLAASHNGDGMPATMSKKPKARNLPNEIKCILLQGYGSVKQMKAISIPRPTPGDGEVLVHVKSW